MGKVAVIPLPLVPKPLVFSPFPLGLRHPRTPQGVPREGWGVPPEVPGV